MKILSVRFQLLKKMLWQHILMQHVKLKITTASSQENNNMFPPPTVNAKQSQGSEPTTLEGTSGICCCNVVIFRPYLTPCNEMSHDAFKGKHQEPLK